MSNKKQSKSVIRVTVGIDSSDHEQLSELANEAGVSLSWMLRRAAQEFLENHGDSKEPSSVVLNKKSGAVK